MNQDQAPVENPAAAEPEKHGFERVRDLLPALMKLGSRKQGIELILQTTATDCGAACLAMILAYNGRHVSLEEIREGMSVGRDGVSARAILEAGSRYDLRGRGVRIEIDDLKDLARAEDLWRARGDD